VKTVRRDTRLPAGIKSPAERRALIEAQLAPLVVLGFGDEGLVGAEAIHQFLVGALGVKGDNGSKVIKNPRRLIDWIKRFPDWDTVIIRPRWKHRPWYTTKTRLLAWIFSDPWQRRERERRRHRPPERRKMPVPLSVPPDPYVKRQRYSPPIPDTDPGELDSGLAALFVRIGLRRPHRSANRSPRSVTVVIAAYRNARMRPRGRRRVVAPYALRAAAGRAPLEPQPAARQLIGVGRSVRRLRASGAPPPYRIGSMDRTRRASRWRTPGRSRR
jgi:hypothetical protein